MGSLQHPSVKTLKGRMRETFLEQRLLEVIKPLSRQLSSGSHDIWKQHGFLATMRSDKAQHHHQAVSPLMKSTGRQSG